MELLRGGNADGMLAATKQVQAVYGIAIDGALRNANSLKAPGNALDEIRGQHHATFVEPVFGQSAARDWPSVMHDHLMAFAQFRGIPNPRSVYEPFA